MGNQAVTVVQSDETKTYPDQYHGIQLLKFISKNITIEERVVRNLKRPRYSLMKEPRVSIKPEYEPPPDVGFEHPTNWLWEYENWAAYVDEQGNMYYYNNVTGESTWDPPADLQQAYNLPVYNTTDALLVEPPLPEDTEAESSVATPEEDAVDIELVWMAFSAACDIPLDTLLQRWNDAKRILETVSQGNYAHSLLVMLSWAYKFHQFKDALMNCFLAGAHYQDSSKYDNCDGIPQFAGGFAEWYLYTEASHASCAETLGNTQTEEEQEAKEQQQMEQLESVIAGGSDSELHRVLQARITVLEGDLEVLQARCLAIVSVEGGPSKEALDNIYHYLRDAIERDVDLEDIQDETEELVQNQIEARHKFLVDIIVSIVFIELEMEALQSRLAALVESTSGYVLDADVAAVLEEMVAQLEAAGSGTAVDVSAIDEQVVVKEEELQAMKESQLTQLRADSAPRLETRITELMNSGLSEEAARKRAAEELADEEQQAAESIDTAIIASLVQFKVEALDNALGDSGSSGGASDDEIDNKINKNVEILATIKAEHNLQEQALKNQIEVKRSVQLKKMNERLANLKQKRAQELAAAGVPVYEAVEQATREISDERMKTEIAIAKRSEEELSNLDETALKQFKELEQKAATKLDVEMSAKEAKMRRDLAAKVAAKNRLKELNRSKVVVVGETKEVPPEETGDDAAEAKEMEDKIANLRHSHEMKVARLQDEILMKKGSASSSLSHRLEVRKTHQALVSKSSSPVMSSLKLTIAPTGEVSLEEFISSAKSRHKQAVHRLKSFLAHERATYETNCAHLSASIIVESILTGYKKQGVYEVKALTARGDPSPLTEIERAQSINEAAAQMFKRYDRDLKNLMETLHNERHRDVKLLLERGASRSKVFEAEQRRDVYDLDQVRKEQGKLLYSLAGLSININLLNTVGTPKPVSPARYAGSNDDDEGFDDEENYDSINTFLPLLSKWKDWMMRLEDIYARSVPCLYSLFYATHTKLIHRVDGELLQSSSRSMLMTAFRFTMVLLGKAFVYNTVPQQTFDASYFGDTSNETDFMSHQLADTVDTVKSDGSLLACFSNENAPDVVRFEYSEALSQFFVRPAFTAIEVQELYLILARPATPAITTQQQINTEILKSLKTLMQRRANELKDQIKSAGLTGADSSDLQRELRNFDDSFSTIESLVLTAAIDASKTTAECLMVALTQMASGDNESLTNERLVLIEKSLKAAAEQKEVQRILELQASSAEKLDISLKLQKVKEKQALQNKLLQRKTKKLGS